MPTDKFRICVSKVEGQTKMHVSSVVIKEIARQADRKLINLKVNYPLKLRNKKISSSCKKSFSILSSNFYDILCDRK